MVEAVLCPGALWDHDPALKNAHYLEMRVLFQAGLQSRKGVAVAYVSKNMASVRNTLTQPPSATEDLRNKGDTNTPASGPISANTGRNPGSHYHNSEKYTQSIL